MGDTGNLQSFDLRDESWVEVIDKVGVLRELGLREKLLDRLRMRLAK